MGNTKRVEEVLTAVHDQVAEFAKRSYASDGRGVVMFGVPDPPDGFCAALLVTDMSYHTLDSVRTSTAATVGESQADVANLVQMIESYDPAAQAVVMLSVGDDVVNVKMKLVPPVIADEPARVQ
jgi:hypothetical protein